MNPQLVLLAGPNGAGKSTFFDIYLGESPLPFLNADLLAKELEVESLEAARILDATRDRMIADKLGFITETVFSDPYGHKLAMLKSAIDAGYEVRIIYIGVSSTKLLLLRVDQRIATGGHDVPRDRIAARFKRSLDNLAKATALGPIVELFDNSSAERPFKPVAKFKAGKLEWRMAGALPGWARKVVTAPKRKR